MLRSGSWLSASAVGNLIVAECHGFSRAAAGVFTYMEFRG